GALTKDSGLVSLLGNLAVPTAIPEFNEQWLTELANDLVAKAGASVVVAGQQQPVVVQLLAYAINSTLHNIGRTIVVREFQRNRNPQRAARAAESRRAGINSGNIPRNQTAGRSSNRMVEVFARRIRGACAVA